MILQKPPSYATLNLLFASPKVTAATPTIYPSPSTPTHTFFCWAFPLEHSLSVGKARCCHISSCLTAEELRNTTWNVALPWSLRELINKIRSNLKDIFGLGEPWWYSDMKWHCKQDKCPMVSWFPKTTHTLVQFLRMKMLSKSPEEKKSSILHRFDFIFFNLLFYWSHTSL